MKKTINKSDMDQVNNARMQNILKKVASGKSLTSTEERFLNECRSGGFIGNVNTILEASKKLGVPVNILKTAKRLHAPGFEKSHINCDTLKAWMDANPTALTDQMTPMEKQKFRKLKAEADRKEFELSVRRGEFMSKDAVRSTMARHITTARSVMSGKGSGLAMILASLTGADATMIEEKIKARDKEVIAELHIAGTSVRSVTCTCGKEIAI